MHQDSTPEIPYGHCHCGCGRRTNIARDTNHKFQRVRGEPSRFLPGHQNRRPQHVAEGSDLDRFWKHVDKTGGDDSCWYWTGPMYSNGYGKFNRSLHGKRSYKLAHRLSYELTIGPIPEGLTLDHTCRNRACVNPAHLEPVTHTENCQRGAKARREPYCKNGHLRTPENTFTYTLKNGKARSTCLICKRVEEREYYAKNRERILRMKNEARRRRLAAHDK